MTLRNQMLVTEYEFRELVRKYYEGSWKTTRKYLYYQIRKKEKELEKIYMKIMGK